LEALYVHAQTLTLIKAHYFLHSRSPHTAKAYLQWTSKGPDFWL